MLAEPPPRGKATGATRARASRASRQQKKRLRDLHAGVSSRCGTARTRPGVSSAPLPAGALLLALHHIPQCARMQSVVGGIRQQAAFGLCDLPTCRSRAAQVSRRIASRSSANRRSTLAPRICYSYCRSATLAARRSINYNVSRTRRVVGRDDDRDPQTLEPHPPRPDERKRANSPACPVCALAYPPLSDNQRALCVSLARSIPERDAQPDSWHLNGTGALWSDEVKRVGMRLRPAEAARARVETHTPER